MRPTSLNATTFALLVGDILIFATSLVLALTIREFAIPNASFLFSHTLPFVLLLIVWLGIFVIGGMYDQTYLRIKRSIGSTLFMLQAIGTSAAVLMFYLLSGLVVTPKTNLALFVVIFTILIWIWRKVFFTHIKPSTQSAIFIGDQSDSPVYLQKDNMLGISMVDEMSWKEFSTKRNLAIDAIIVDTSSNAFEEHALTVQEHVFNGTRLIDLTNLNERVYGSVNLDSVENNWLLEYMEPPTRLYLVTKRLLDVIAGVLLACVLLLVIPFVAVGQLLTEKHVSLFFSQKRIGKKGEPFTMYKLRSMSVSDGDTWSTKNHDRITSTGKVIRALRVDELPQAINVLKGEMSLVGPRALMPSEQTTMEEHSDLYRMRLFTTPGITGWAQISMPHAPANKAEALERLGYDLYYIQHASMLFDMLIILKTLKTIVLKTGLRAPLAKRKSMT